MDRLIYTSLTALRGAQARQTATANNLANVSTPGFRTEMAEAQAIWLRGPQIDGRAVASEEVIGADMHAGTVISTGRELDIAIEGSALLGVQAPNGEEAYTRRGDLQLAESGLLTTGDGHPVLGTQGSVIVPPADSVHIDRDGRLWVVPQGGDPQAPQEVARLKLASPVGSTVLKGLDGLFRVPGGGILPEDPEARVKSGALEGSNVNATLALTEMIEASRNWDVQLKMIGDARDLDAATAELMQLPQ
ncbi:MAG: flagellar basal body rod protein FlgF [Sphingomonadales bacterium]|jgi:flagellar basal-body rod protein FlgF|nr:flagellar basal body rod protein FlgF [Sphingomonadales bacterium]MBK9005159.1 flagellar basal body rod protein FlgF [Sphingomonadales bacterium]MBK9267107.1 flagellar basal body rod protein FlgF [Sphingomonadales bacterium]MBP6433088.1 flagellar basal body rod protein FlgF [Sphingorhabdus sp.]